MKKRLKLKPRLNCQHLLITFNQFIFADLNAQSVRCILNHLQFMRSIHIVDKFHTYVENHRTIINQ